MARATLDSYIDSESYVEHNPQMSDGLEALREVLSNNVAARNYEKIHRVLAEGSFVLCVSEGYRGEEHVSFYDLFRLADRKIVEHWDTVDPVPPHREWLNNNGKF